MMAAQVGRRRSIVWFSLLTLDIGSCQNYGPFLGTLNIRCRIIVRTQKGTLILTTTHIGGGAQATGVEAARLEPSSRCPESLSLKHSLLRGSWDLVARVP